MSLCTGTSATLDAANTGSIYLWSTGATTQTILVNNNSSGLYNFYYVTVKNNSGCKLSFMESVLSNTGCRMMSEDGINNIYANSVFYPNPTRSIFTIRSLNNNAIGNIIIYNLLGDIVYEHNCLDTEVQIDVLYLPTGIYTIYMQGFRSKLIKEN